ncbi:MAG: phosphoribosyltransferase family protein [Mucinivorans sp.]
MKIHDIDFEPYLSADSIDESIGRLAEKINRDYADAREPILLLITLSGAMIFASRLVLQLKVPVELAFVKCSSYGSKRVSSGRIAFQVEPTASLLGRDVLVVEDIVDTGNTWVALHTYIEKQGALSIRIATMLLKKEIYNKPLPIDYTAIEVSNDFLVGYGLDYNLLGRNINGIYKARQE